LSPLIPLFSWREKDLGAQKLYGAIVAQTRLPVFYQGLGVPDTLEGRFVVLSLNLFAVLHRLKADGAETRGFAQELTDQFTADMETVLRELGVGDLGIPKKMRGLAASSAALLQGYDEALESGESALTSTIAEALPLERPAAEAASERLADYLKGVIRRLDTEPLSVLQTGEVKFPEIDLEFREMAPRKAENFRKKG
jgi:cytochrome b pre-mRNA-processing protein 3